MRRGDVALRLRLLETKVRLLQSALERAEDQIGNTYEDDLGVAARPLATLRYVETCLRAGGYPRRTTIDWMRVNQIVYQHHHDAVRRIFTEPTSRLYFSADDMRKGIS